MVNKLQLEVKAFLEKDRLEKLFWLFQEVSYEELEAVAQKLEKHEPHKTLTAFTLTKKAVEEDLLDARFQKRMYLEMTGEDMVD